MPGPIELLIILVIYCLLLGVPSMVAAWFIARTKGRHPLYWAFTALLFNLVALLVLLFLKPVVPRSGAFPVIRDRETTP